MLTLYSLRPKADRDISKKEKIQTNLLDKKNPQQNLRKSNPITYQKDQTLQIEYDIFFL